VRIGIFQSSPQKGQVGINLDRIATVLCLYPGVDLWVMPELATTGYLFHDETEVRRLAEPVPGGATTGRLRELTAQLDTALVIGVAERAEDGCFNSALVFERGTLSACYRKIHLFWDEKRWFRPGQHPPPVVKIGDATVGVMICFDWIFPETARSLALQGAQLIVHPSNLVLPYCQDAMLTRSLENRVFTVTANRIGSESLAGGKQLTFTGRSQLTTPDGERLLRLSADREEVAIVNIDPARADNKWLTPANHLFEDRRELLDHF